MSEETTAKRWHVTLLVLAAYSIGLALGAAAALTAGRPKASRPPAALTPHGESDR